jgi:hypothetical protein
MARIVGMRGVTAVYVSTCKLLYDVLATNGCGEVKGGVVLVVEYHDIKGKGRIWDEFARQMKIGFGLSCRQMLTVTSYARCASLKIEGSRKRGGFVEKRRGRELVSTPFIELPFVEGGKGVRRTGRTR